MKLNRKQMILYGSAVLSLVVFWVLSAFSGTLMPDTQQAAERWQADGELDYAQISLFFGQEASFTTVSAEGVSETINFALQNASLKAEEGKRLWMSAWSTQLGEIPMSGTKVYSASALATAVGGDFFKMHPMTLLDGTYISDDDLMHDLVVLDEMTAWQLFGSSKVSGMEVIVNDRRCIVAGVVRPEQGHATEQAYGEKPRFYASYALCREWSEEESMTVHCYEAVLPNLVRGFAQQTLTDAVGERDSMRVVQNTDRSALSKRWYNLRHVHEMLVNPDSAAFPYWENAARIVDYDLAVLLGLEILFLVLPVGCGLLLLAKGYKWVNRFIAEKRQAHKNRFRSEIPQV